MPRDIIKELQDFLNTNPKPDLEGIKKKFSSTSEIYSKKLRYIRPDSHEKHLSNKDNSADLTRYGDILLENDVDIAQVFPPALIFSYLSSLEELKPIHIKIFNQLDISKTPPYFQVPPKWLNIELMKEKSLSIIQNQIQHEKISLIVAIKKQIETAKDKKDIETIIKVIQEKKLDIALIEMALTKAPKALEAVNKENFSLLIDQLHKSNSPMITRLIENNKNNSAVLQSLAIHAPSHLASWSLQDLLKKSYTQPPQPAFTAYLLDERLRDDPQLKNTLNEKFKATTLFETPKLNQPDLFFRVLLHRARLNSGGKHNYKKYLADCNIANAAISAIASNDLTTLNKALKDPNNKNCSKRATQLTEETVLSYFKQKHNLPANLDDNKNKLFHKLVKQYLKLQTENKDQTPIVSDKLTAIDSAIQSLLTGKTLSIADNLNITKHRGLFSFGSTKTEKLIKETLQITKNALEDIKGNKEPSNGRTIKGTEPKP